MSVDETLLCSFQVCHILVTIYTWRDSTLYGRIIDTKTCREESEVPIRWSEHGSAGHTSTEAEEEGLEQDGLRGWSGCYTTSVPPPFLLSPLSICPSDIIIRAFSHLLHPSFAKLLAVKVMLTGILVPARSCRSDKRLFWTVGQWNQPLLPGSINMLELIDLRFRTRATSAWAFSKCSYAPHILSLQCAKVSYIPFYIVRVLILSLSSLSASFGSLPLPTIYYAPSPDFPRRRFRAYSAFSKFIIH